MQYDSFVTHNIDMYMGKPKSGKTTIAGTYPKPLLYVSVGNDGGGRVLAKTQGIFVKNLRNDFVRKKTTIELLAEILAELRKPGADKFKTIVIDTIGALQDDYKQYLEFTKGGRALSQQEWGDVSKMMLSVKDTMKRFSEEMGVQFVWLTHTNEMELYETSGLDKEIRIIPDLTIKTGVKYMKDASNIFYCCRKTILDNNGRKSVQFLVYVGPHPLIDTGTRDMTLAVGDFVDNFTYDKWQKMIAENSLNPVNLVKINNEEKETEETSND